MVVLVDGLVVVVDVLVVFVLNRLFDFGWVVCCFVPVGVVLVVAVL